MKQLAGKGRIVISRLSHEEEYIVIHQYPEIPMDPVVLSQEIGRALARFAHKREENNRFLEHTSEDQKIGGRKD